MVRYRSWPEPIACHVMDHIFPNSMQAVMLWHEKMLPEWMQCLKMVIKPTVLIGSSGVRRTFTKEVIETATTFNEKPIIMALSNPTSQSKCTAEEAYTWSQGRAIFASGSPFDPVQINEKVFVPTQANNAYIFPGLGFWLVISGAIRVHDEMLLVAAKALAGQVTEEDFNKGMIYPSFSKIRDISAHIAAKVYELGVATHLPQPTDLLKHAKSCMYSPVYRKYR